MKAKIKNISEVPCQECQYLRRTCHGLLKNFPSQQCATQFLERIGFEMDGFGDRLFTLAQFHQKLIENVYPYHRDVEDKVALSVEVLIKFFIIECDFVRHHGITRFQVVPTITQNK